ncbi:MAG: uracil-DNA glycosylase [Pseudomonadota bacterium]
MRQSPREHVQTDPGRNCGKCPRLVAYRQDLRTSEPDWFNAPVPSFGDPNAELLIVGLAPGVTGANRTGRPFTGDYAGDLLYTTLSTFGFSVGTFRASLDDGLELKNCMITNAVRCVPPQNKPIGAEIKECRPYLGATWSSLPKLKVLIALGRVAHTSTIATFGGRQKDFPFGHAAEHQIEKQTLIDSFHCSRYNTNTGRLTETMFHAVFQRARELLDG